MSTINTGDKFLVNRDNTSYQLEAKDTMAELQDTDLMLVNRGGTSYKINGADIKESLDPTSPPIINSVTLTEDNPGGDRFTNQSFTTTVNINTPGEPAANFGIKPILQAEMIDKKQTNVITAVNTVSGTWGDEQQFPGEIRAITYSEEHDLWVAAIMSQNYFLYSSDGENWSQSNGLPGDTTWTAITSGNGVFVAVGQGSPKIIWSEDGINWNSYSNSIQVPTESRLTYEDVTFGGSYFLATGDSNGGTDAGSMSADGKVWTKAGLTSNGSYPSVVYGQNGYFNITTTSSHFYGRATNPTIRLSWGANGYPGGGDQRLILFGGDGESQTSSRLVSIPDRAFGSNELKISDAGIGDWVNYPAPVYESVSYWSAGLYAAGIYCVVGHGGGGNNKSMWSTDGITWTSTNTGQFDWNCIAYGQGKFLIGGHVEGSQNASLGRIKSSLTGGPLDSPQLTLTDDKDLIAFQHDEVINQSNYLQSGKVGSVDVANKTINVSGITGAWSSGFTAVGPNRNLTSSQITNVSSTSGPSNVVDSFSKITYIPSIEPDIRDAAVGNGLIVVANRAGDVNHRPISYASSDGGATWTEGQVQDGLVINYGGLAYGNGRFVLVGELSGSNQEKMIKTSTDGLNWSSAGVNFVGYSDSSQASFSSVGFGDGKFLASTFSGFVSPWEFWESTDGLTWTNPGPTYSPSAVMNRTVIKYWEHQKAWVFMSNNSTTIYVIPDLADIDTVQTMSIYGESSVGQGNQNATPALTDFDVNGDRLIFCWGNGTNGGGSARITIVTPNDPDGPGGENPYWAQSRNRRVLNDEAGGVWDANWHHIQYGGGVWMCASAQNNNAAYAKSFQLSYDNGDTWEPVDYAPVGDQPSVEYNALVYDNGNFIGFKGNGFDLGYFAQQTYLGGASYSDLTFSSNQTLSSFKEGLPIKQQSTGYDNGEGTLVSASGNSIRVMNRFTYWNTNTGSAVYQPDSSFVTNASLFGLLTANLQITDLTSIDPGFVKFTGTQPKVTFAPIFPDGQSPDATLLSGTSIKTVVQADNLVYNPAEKTSNIITPNVARTDGFDSNNSAEVIEFNLVKNSLETYETERDTRRSNLKSAMVAANFTDEDITVAGLDDA